MYLLYSLSINDHFLKTFLARYACSIAFYPPLRNASMQYVLPTPFRPILLFVSLSLTDSFQNSLKTRTKLRIKCPKIVCGVGVAEGVGRRENGGKSAMVVGG